MAIKMNARDQRSYAFIFFFSFFFSQMENILIAIKHQEEVWDCMGAVIFYVRVI